MNNLDETISSFDERRDIALPGDHDEMIEFATKHWIHLAQESIESHGHFYVALSGGSTPKKIFAKLAEPKYREAVDWKSVVIFWSDERSVAPDHPDSNYKMAMDAGFAKLPIDKQQVFRMKAESDIEEHAKEYESLIQQRLKGRGFDLIMLGMGDDGHTASLFPHTRALEIKDRLVVANEVPQKGTYRMTFTFPLINSAHNIVFYVAGSEKSERLHQVLYDQQGSYPAAQVGSTEHHALWIIDDQAGRKLVSLDDTV